MSVRLKNLNQLEQYLKTAVNIALDEYVANEVVSRLTDNAAQVVYESFTPNTYDYSLKDRRYSLLRDKNYEINRDADMKVSVTPIAEFNPTIWVYSKLKKEKVERPSQNSGDMLAGLINYGNGWNGYEYDFDEKDEYGKPLPEQDRVYTVPRPFLDITKQELEDGLFRALLGEGLEEQGISVEYK